jgi:hypothetical protein
MIRATVAMIALIVALAVPAVASADPPAASVIAVSFQPGANFFNIVVTIPKGIENAASNGNANFGLHVTVTYLDANNQVQTLDSGLVPVASTGFLCGDTCGGTIAKGLVAVTFELPLSVAPNQNPQYNPTAEILHPGSG